MSTDEQNVGTVEQRLRLGPGLLDKDRQQVFDALSSLDRHLAHWKPEQVDLRVSVRDRDYLDQRVTLEIWLPGRHTVLAHGSDRDLERALIEVRKAAIREIEHEADRRRSHPTSAHHVAGVGLDEHPPSSWGVIDPGPPPGALHS